MGSPARNAISKAVSPSQGSGSSQLGGRGTVEALGVILA